MVCYPIILSPAFSLGDGETFRRIDLSQVYLITQQLAEILKPDHSFQPPSSSQYG